MNEKIKSRLDAATTSENKWNSWPDKMEVVRVTRYDLSDAVQALNAGILKGMGLSGDYRQIIPSKIPKEVGIRIDHSIIMAHFIHSYPKGQIDNEEKRNLYVVFDEWPDVKTYAKRNVVEVEIGCKHDYLMKYPSNCYREGRCLRCGHEWACDSGD